MIPEDEFPETAVRTVVARIAQEDREIRIVALQAAVRNQPEGQFPRRVLEVAEQYADWIRTGAR